MKLLTIPQDTIKISVDFYDDAEKGKLLTYPTAPTLVEMAATGIEIPTAELLTYYLFHRKRLGSRGYRDYETIARKIHIALAHMDECVEFNGSSIVTPPGTAHQLPEVSEHIGEAVGLSVISRAHGLTEADWTPIQQQYGRNALKTFDSALAANGIHFVEVENKGSSVDDNKVISKNISQHKRSITEKKVKIAQHTALAKGPASSALRYGTIAAIDPQHEVRCWLVDPAPEASEWTPRGFKLLQRMRFLRDWISFISPRSQFASALATRTADLENLREPLELDGVALSRGDGDPFEFVPYDVFGHHSSFLASKSRITDGPAGGVVVQLSKSALLFLGIRENLVVAAATQSFENILSMRSESASLNKTVECVFSRGRFDRLELPATIASAAEERGGYVSFRLSGRLHYSPGGSVFGALPLPVD